MSKKKTVLVGTDRYEVESSNPGYPELEKQLFKFWNKHGWKSLTAFLVGWTDKLQPEDTKYTLRYWAKEMKPERARKQRPIKLNPRKKKSA